MERSVKGVRRSVIGERRSDSDRGEYQADEGFLVIVRILQLDESGRRMFLCLKGCFPRKAPLSSRFVPRAGVASDIEDRKRME
jgi:hypothetical protein